MSTHDRDDAGPASSPRDPALERAWHLASVEQPPDATDARILAAARAAAAPSQGRSTSAPTRLRLWRGPTRWQSVLAAAAVAGLAFVLVPRTANLPPRDLAVPSSPERQESVAAPAEIATSPGVDAASNDTRDTRPAPATSPPRDDAPRRSRSSVPPPPAATAEKAAAGPDATAGAAAPYGASGIERSDAAKSAVAVDAAAWAARIEALYAAGDVESAAREFRAFRAAVPEAEMHLSPALREWARTVP